MSVQDLEDFLEPGEEARQRIGAKLNAVLADFVAKHNGVMPSKLVVGWADASDGMGVIQSLHGIPVEVDQGRPIRFEAVP